MAEYYYGLQKTTLLDFPGLVAAVIFFPGCNFRCPYCHNPDLINPQFREGLLSEKELLEFLQKRAPVLGGIVLSGGEPLLHPVEALSRLIDKIRGLGLKIKIDTNGSFPERLKSLSPDYIAMDIKTSPGKYPLVGYGKTEIMMNKVLESVGWIIGSGIPHEFRTTVVPGIVDFEDIKIIADILKGAGAYYLARFQPDITLDPEYTKIIPYNTETLEEMKNYLVSKGVKTEIR